MTLSPLELDDARLTELTPGKDLELNSLNFFHWFAPLGGTYIVRAAFYALTTLA